MKDLLDKISSYNIFNYLLPGVVFSVLAEIYTDFKFIQTDNLIGAFYYYFIGLIISRFGSLIVEPLLQKVSFLKFVNYSSFVKASKKDDKIEILSEVNNTYRSITSLLVVLCLLLSYEYLEKLIPLLTEFRMFIILFLLLSIFLFSYKKQTEYIKKRVEIEEQNEC